MGMLTRDAILKAGLPRKQIAVPEWNGDVFIRTLSGKERVEMLSKYDTEENTTDKKTQEKALYTTFWLVSKCLCDENGKELFTADDVAGLDGAPVQKIFSECLTYSGLSKKAQENAEKNLPRVQS